MRILVLMLFTLMFVFFSPPNVESKETVKNLPGFECEQVDEFDQVQSFEFASNVLTIQEEIVRNEKANSVYSPVLKLPGTGKVVDQHRYSKINLKYLYSNIYSNKMELLFDLRNHSTYPGSTIVHLNFNK